MKHLFTVLAAGLLLPAVTAEAQLQVPAELKQGLSLQERAAKMRAISPAKQFANTRAEYSEIIYEAEGETKDYIKTYDGCYVYLDMEYVNGQEVETQIVWGDDNAVYFPNLISMMPTDSYTKGILDGDKITVSFPQTVFFEEYEYDGETIQSYYHIALVKAEETDGMLMYNPVMEENEITFSVADDGTVTMNPLEEGYAIGMIAEDNYGTYWMGFAEFAMSFTPDNSEKEIDPSELDNTPYSYFCYGYDTPTTVAPDFGFKVNVAYDGDDVYFTGISIDEPRWWVKGHKDGNRVILDNNQVMGTVMNTYTASLMFGKRDPEAYGGFSLLPADTKFVFEYDEEANVFKTATPEVIMFINILPDQIYFLTMLENPTFIYQPDAAGEPADPWNIIFNASTYDKYGYGVLDVNLPIVSTDGVLLDRNNMYYQIYFDGELATNEAAEYGLPEDTENIPYNFDANAIVCSRISTYHEMIFHTEGFEKIGVKLLNEYDGVVYESNLVELDVIPGEVTSAVAQTPVSNEVSQHFYDLSGRSVANPLKGIFIKKSILEDGSVKVSKVFRK